MRGTQFPTFNAVAAWGVGRIQASQSGKPAPDPGSATVSVDLSKSFNLSEPQSSYVQTGKQNMSYMSFFF